MLSLKKNNKGISLALTIGLLSLIMVAAAFASNLVIRSLQSSHRIESSDKAYFSAEAGIEDALYELSNHFAGYETPDIAHGGTPAEDEVRNSDFSEGSGPSWTNNWEIKNLMTGADDFTGQLVSGQTLTINAFSDDTGDMDAGVNGINPNPSDTNARSVNTLSVAFRIPHDVPTGYSLPFMFTGTLLIDNDNDGLLNEDGPDDFDENGCDDGGLKTADADCDGKENEDHADNPVITWEISDDEGRTLVAEKGCMKDFSGSEICEKDFNFDGTDIIAHFNPVGSSLTGIDESGNHGILIDDFLTPNYDGRTPDSQLKIKFFVSAPLIQSYDAGTGTVAQVVNIPYISYKVIPPGGTLLPMPYFTIKSDGWFADFKQSLTAYITPKTDAPLLGGVGVTIIQQE